MNQTRIKTIFHFHELSLPVIEHIGMNWRTALRTLQTDSRTKFFHFQHLNVPLPSGLGGSCATQTPVILLQKVHFYIAQTPLPPIPAELTEISEKEFSGENQ